MSQPHVRAAAPRTRSQHCRLNGRGTGRVPLHSTRLRGYHLRHYQAPDRDSWEYSAWIFRGEKPVGHVVYGGETDLILDILPQHRASWQRLLRFIDAHPLCADFDGNPKRVYMPEEHVLSILQEIARAERRFNRSRDLVNGILGFTWRNEHYAWWPTPITYVGGDAPVTPASIPLDVFHLLTIGADNRTFVRATAPPPAAPIKATR